MQLLFLIHILAVNKLQLLLEMSQHLDGARDLSTQLRQLLQYVTVTRLTTPHVWRGVATCTYGAELAIYSSLIPARSAVTQ